LKRSVRMSSYFDNAFRKTDETIDFLCKKLTDGSFGKIDFITGIGMSGTLLLLSVSRQIKIPFVALRKEGESSHSKSDVFSFDPLVRNKYVIIDDFIETGNTINGILEKMRYMQCMGILLYQSSESLHQKAVELFPELRICSSYDFKKTFFAEGVKNEDNSR